MIILFILLTGETNMTTSTFQEIVESIEQLSIEDQNYLFEMLRQKREQQKTNTFWDVLQECRKIIETENIVFTDEDFADLRDKSPGREVNL
jgi:Ulp1 family protease